MENQLNKTLKEMGDSLLMLINATSWASTTQSHFLQETENDPNPRDRNRALFLRLLSHDANRKVSNSFLKHCRKRFESETLRTCSMGWQKVKQSLWCWVVVSSYRGASNTSWTRHLFFNSHYMEKLNWIAPGFLFVCSFGLLIRNLKLN